MKSVYALAFALSVMIFSTSCSRKEAPVEAEAVPVSDKVEVENDIDAAFVTLSINNIDAAKEIVEKIGNLYKDEKTNEADKYLEKLIKWCEDNEDELNTLPNDSAKFAALIETVKGYKVEYTGTEYVAKDVAEKDSIKGKKSSKKSKKKSKKSKKSDNDSPKTDSKSKSSNSKSK